MNAAAEDWLAIGLSVREALKSGSWRETAITSTEWLVARSRTADLSVQTLRRSAAMTGFAEQLAQYGALATPADAGKLSLAKLELVSKIWELSPVQAADAVRAMIPPATKEPTLRTLRKIYSDLVVTTGKALGARKTGKRSARASVARALRDIGSLPELVGARRSIALPAGKMLPYVVVDGVVARHVGHGYLAEEAVIVVRPREIANRTALIPLLAQSSWAASFFDRLWIVGRAGDFPVGFVPDPKAAPLDEIKSFRAHLVGCGASNIGILELTDGPPRVVLAPGLAPIPDRRSRMRKTLKLKPEHFVEGIQVGGSSEEVKSREQSIYGGAAD